MLFFGIKYHQKPVSTLSLAMIMVLVHNLQYTYINPCHSPNNFAIIIFSVLIMFLKLKFLKLKKYCTKF